MRVSLRALSAGGDWRWIRTSGQVVERNALGQPIRMLGLHVITHELREALAAAESATRAKGEFLANMSHEIRTPMTAVLGDAELLEAEARAGTLPERIETAVASIGSHTRQLLGIMSDILEVSQIDAGRVTLTPVPTDPRQLVEEALAPHRSALEAKGLGLSVSVDADVPPQITTDPSRCHRILTKLIGNAIKFTASGSVRIQLRCDRAAQRLCVDVSDTGIGLTDIEREALLRFDAFHQTDASMSRRYGGTGLGLRIAHSLAALLGGQISIRSCRGQGSTFTLQVPTGSIESEVPPMARLGASAEDTASALLPLEGLHLLLVDDNAVNQRVVGLLLERAGARLTRANDGQDAIVAVAAADAPFHVIIMDMQMPVLDGYAATRGLRDQGYQHPIVALTAHALSGDRERCLAAGCDDYLTKPVDKALLIATCARQALRHGPIAPSVHKTPGPGPAR